MTPHPLLSSETLHLWTVQVSELRDSPSEWESLLSTEERERSARFHRKEDGERFVLAHGLLRLLLGRYLSQTPESLRFVINPFGKPQLFPLPEPPLRFNISHSGDYVLLAFVETGQVGVDVEVHRNELVQTELGRDIFSDSEYEFLISQPLKKQKEVFFDLWTGKEAVLKARGMGLSLDLKSFDIKLSDNKVSLTETRDDLTEAKRWQMRIISLNEGYSAAAAFDAKIETVEVYKFWG